MQPVRPFTCLALTLGLLVSACQKPPAAVVEAPPPLPPHLGPPPAALCTVAPVHVADGASGAVAMTISNDGGFCAAALTNDAGQPFDAPLVPAKPLHGDQTVVKYNGKTSIEYAAKPGFVGHDSFVVKLITRGKVGYTTVNLSIDVTSGTAKTS